MSEQVLRSRRSLLAAATGAIGAFFLQAAGRPAPALAEGETVVVGGEFTTATSVTKITSTTNGITVAEFRNGATGATGIGLKAHSNNGTAAIFSSSNLTPAPRADTTIYGFHNGSGLGHTPVTARFESTEQSSQFTTAIALQVVGKSEFKKSGVATVLAGQTTVVVPVNQVDANSFMLATLQAIRPGITVAAVTKQVANGTITIKLSGAPTSDTKVGWWMTQIPV